MPEIDVGRVALITTDDPIPVTILAIAERPDGSGRHLQLQRAESFTQEDRDLGQDTYCLVTEDGAVYYGGVLDWSLDQDSLRIALTQSAQDALGVDGVYVLELRGVRPHHTEVELGMREIVGGPGHTGDARHKAQPLPADALLSASMADLEALAARGDGDLQSMIIQVAAERFGPASSPLLLRLSTQGKDTDVRDEAVAELSRTDPEGVRKLTTVLRRRLRSPDFWAPVTAMWALAQIGDKESLTQIETLRTDQRRPIVRNTAVVVSMVLSGQGDEIVARILSHDHSLMPWLTRAARILATQSAIDALLDCAVRSPDPKCARLCSTELRILRGVL